MVCCSAIVFLAGLCGCGYTTRSLVASPYHTVYIPPFENKIDITNELYAGSKHRLYRPQLVSEVTRAIINRYLYDGNIKPLDKEDADLVLKGEVIEFRKDPLRYSDADNVEEYRVSVVVSISLQDAQAKTELWREDRFVGDATYYLQGPEAKSEDAAITDAVNDLARRVVERTVEQW